MWMMLLHLHVTYKSDDDENEYANKIIFNIRPLDERHKRTCQIVQLMIQKTCNDGLGLKFVYSWCFISFTSFFKVFINS